MDATTMSGHDQRDDIIRSRVAAAQPVSRTEVEQVLAGEEADNGDAPHQDTDYVDTLEEDDVVEDLEALFERQAQAPYLQT